MAPIRRYLRITKYSVLECRIYVDNPALAESWLLNPRTPVLPRVIESVRPLVLPKIREESERSKTKSGKRKGVKDVVVEEDFEVSIFLTETSTRHSLLTKQKNFREKGKKSLESNSHKLIGATNETAIDVEDASVIRREETEEDGLNLQDFPVADAVDSLFVAEDEEARGSKRPRATRGTEWAPGSSQDSSPGSEPLQKRRRDTDAPAAEPIDDKKKMILDTSYEGFAIYGRVLCLVVKRREANKGSSLSGGQAMMEDWITSTQMPPLDDDG
ncbi:Uncharacterized protein BP5553_09918 [Venustampulla echinocandica]|uniref:Uncharacterized protein n=1 Tax=Venustampulla echinocandica TaxID=2656787 RepID=A0A370TB27_9HELO|nr:Uncharacterized protein BP5553_09918 [Venustampulla echinocandica]RDL31129.1 Uncharacterized protein BP5553_09918 [Venustampulla echinocandica]